MIKEEDIADCEVRALLKKIFSEAKDQVIVANRASKALQETHVQGIGHEFWVNETTGFTKEE
ncbi:hypothetical protein CULT_40006 [[Clostridium] ultunense Esp]|uniref:hypothetical protein n=1 Tax=Thermicanus aegyptius TaxID=94009 RepID=UPI0002B70C12|nr:hypothetical protein [Thermicanus aegyptius]CCQ96250.1 hypothetical protein CULT_40006 [[Clostridium] ultunense Esp]